MASTLLIGHEGVTWREWLRVHRGRASLLNLDPADSSFGVPGRFVLLQDERPVWTRFFGSLDASRSPHVLVAALAEGACHAGEDVIVKLFDYRATPVLRQTVSLLVEVLRPDRILVAKGTEIDQSKFALGPEEVELEAAFPFLVRSAQRKAHWMKLIEHCTPQVVPLDQVSLEGTRLGTGKKLDAEQIQKMGLASVLHAEVSESGLVLVCDGEPDESAVARALDVTGSKKAFYVDRDMLTHLLCCFARADGEELGMGFIANFDWENREIHTLCTAVPPAPVRILRVGSLRIDPKGRELGELRPWQI